MKFIFDFDDVLFHNTKQFKEHMYASFEKAGVSRDAAEEYYRKIGGSKFWLKEMLSYFSLEESLYDTILKESKNLVNKELLSIIKKLRKENCYIVTHGGDEWQRDKIKYAGMEHLFAEIITVAENKKEAVEKICAKYKNQKVIFVDDKAKHFEDLDFKKYPNLKTILFDEKGLEKVRAEVES